MARASKREATKTALVDDAACAHAAFPPAPPMPELLAAGEADGNLIDEAALSGHRGASAGVRFARGVLLLCVGAILGMAFIFILAVT